VVAEIESGRSSRIFCALVSPQPPSGGTAMLLSVTRRRRPQRRDQAIASRRRPQGRFKAIAFDDYSVPRAITTRDEDVFAATDDALVGADAMRLELTAATKRRLLDAWSASRFLVRYA